MVRRKEEVTRVIDGDTFITASRKNPVRLEGYNAPEKGSRGASKATHDLRNLIQGQKVEVNTVARDVYGRAVAKVKIGNRSVNRIMKDSVSKSKK